MFDAQYSAIVLYVAIVHTFDIFLGIPDHLYIEYIYLRLFDISERVVLIGIALIHIIDANKGDTETRFRSG